MDKVRWSNKACDKNVNIYRGNYYYYNKPCKVALFRVQKAWEIDQMKDIYSIQYYFNFFCPNRN